MVHTKPALSEFVTDTERLERERRLVAEARASVEVGDVVSDEDVDAWLDHMVESSDPMPIPGSKRIDRAS